MFTLFIQPLVAARGCASSTLPPCMSTADAAVGVHAPGDVVLGLQGRADAFEQRPLTAVEGNGIGQSETGPEDAAAARRLVAAHDVVAGTWSDAPA